MKKYNKILLTILIFVSFLVSICFIPIGISSFIPLVEEQVEKDLGFKIHIEKLVMRLGPSIKVKAPIVHLLYKDGQKFAQLNNVKFYITWKPLIKKTFNIKKIKAKRFNARFISDDENLIALLDNLTNNTTFCPDIKFNDYKLSILNKVDNNYYILEGQHFNLHKSLWNNKFKIKANGALFVNTYKHITYDLVLTSIIDNFKLDLKTNLFNYIQQIKELDFCSDIVADVNIYKNSNKLIQASGFVNIDNISVLDKEKKNPKSFLYLTLWGDKASILSNIYTSINKKIYIEGMINNSAKPTFDIKIKADEINLKELYDKIKILLDYSFTKDIDSIDGGLDANFTLKGDLNKIKSSGFLKLSNTRIKAKNLQIDNINSYMDFSNNKINITNTTGYVDKSPIRIDGCIDNDININIVADKIALKYLCPFNLDIKSGTLSLISTINGSLKKLEHKDNIHIENLNINDKNAEFKLDSFNLDTNKSNIAYFKNIVLNTKETSSIKIPSAEATITGNSIKITETPLYMANSKIIYNGLFSNCFNKDFNFVSSFNGFINSKDMNRFNNKSNNYPVKFSINGTNTIQNINLQVIFEKPEIINEPFALNLISKLEKNNLKIEDLSIVSTNGRTTEDLKTNFKGNKKVIITGNIENIFEPIFKNLRIFIPQVLNIKFLDTEAQIKGDVFVNDSILSPEITGQIFIPNISHKNIDLNISNCTADFNKKNIILNMPILKLADISLGLNALLSTSFTEELLIKNINIKAKHINIDTLLMYKDLFKFSKLPVKIQDGKLYSESITGSIYNSKIYLTAYTSDVKLENNILKIKNIVSELYNGKLSGDIDFNLLNESFNTQIMAREVSASPIFNIISAKKDNISGTMDFDASMKGNLSTKTSLLGNIKFIINNGRMSTLGKLEHLLYAQNVIADSMLRTTLSVVTKAITLKDTGLFKYMRGDIEITDGIAHIKLLQTQGPLMALYIKGLYNPINDYAKLIIMGRLSDEVITGLGAFGDFSLNKLMIMLTGEENKYNIYPEDFDKIPQLQVKNTKEFHSYINGIIDKASSVISFNWISYSQKSLREKEVPLNKVKLPEFLNSIP